MIIVRSPSEAHLLIHLLDQGIDVLLSVSKISTFDVVLELPSSEATSRVRQLEWPEEVACLLEIGTDGDNFVNQVLHTHDAVLAKVVFDELVVGKWDALLVDLAISALVNELANRLEVGVAISNVRVDNGKHLLSGLGQTNEDAIIDLEEPEELKNLARFRSNLVDTRQRQMVKGSIGMQLDLTP